MKRNKLVVPVLIGSIAATGFVANFKIARPKQEPKELKSLESNNKYSVSNKTVDEIKEINKKNIDLIVFESDYTDHSLSITDSGILNDIEATTDTEFKYTVTTDLSKCKVTSTNDKIFVHIKEKDIKLKDITINETNISYDTNIFTNLQGKRLIDLESVVIKETYNNIQREVSKQYKLNKELYKLNLSDKLNRLYDSDNVTVLFE